MKQYLFFTIFLIINNLYCQQTTEKDTVKATELKEVVITSKTKAVEQKADRIIFNFSEQAYLNSGSLMDGLKKLPGLIISDVAGMMYQGKQLEVYMDGRPTNIYSDELNSYLQSLPANSVEKVEIITKPGAEFPATSGGAIINIITSKNAKKYLSATYSNGYSSSKYDKNRNKFNNSVLLNAKNKLFSWQIQVGQSYSEGFQRTKFNTDSTIISNNNSDKINRLYFVKSGLKFDIKKDRLLINYDISNNKNNATIDASGIGFISNENSGSNQFRNDVNVIYQKKFDDPSQKLVFSTNYKNNNGNFKLNPQNNLTSILENKSVQNFYQFKTDYTQGFKFLEKTKFSLGILADQLNFKATSYNVENLKYTRNTLASYSELQTTYKSFDFIVGSRLESYDIYGNTNTNKLTGFKQVRFFPNVSIQYNIVPQVYFSANYNKKISLPNTSALNPNNTNYQNQNVNYHGNPNLDPTIFNNYEINFYAMEYFFVGYSISNVNNQVVNRLNETANAVAVTTANIPKMSIQNFNIGLPIPFMLFTKGFKETLKMDFNPDEINFLNFYIEHQKYVIEGLNTKGYWYCNLMAQIKLPQKINFNLNYSTSTIGGNYNYYTMRKPIGKELDVTFSKKFLSNNLSISIYIDDIFNTSIQSFDAIGTNIHYQNKYDTRRFGFSLNYKIPSKNKLAKEENILSKGKNEDNNSGK